MKCYVIKKKGEDLYWYQYDRRGFGPFPKNLRDLYMFVACDDKSVAEYHVSCGMNLFTNCEIVPVNIPEPGKPCEYMTGECYCGKPDNKYDIEV